MMASEPSWSSESADHSYHKGVSSNSMQFSCHVTFPDGRVFHLEMHRKMNGQDCLNKICTNIGVFEEREYFGLQYFGTHGEVLWVNLRNRLGSQMVHPPPYSFYFRVKYYVSLDVLVLEETKHQFYLNTTLQLMLGMWTHQITYELHGKLIALMTQVKFGDYVASTTPCKYACFWPDCCEEVPNEVIRAAADYQRYHLENRDTTALERELLHLVAQHLPSYGMYFYEVKNFSKNRHLIGVGPKGVSVINRDTSYEVHYTYSQIHHVEERHRNVCIYLRSSHCHESSQEMKLNDTSSPLPMLYQLMSRSAALSFYRCVCEMRTFYCCDKLDQQMLNQTLNLSIFASGRNNDRQDYMFDLHYTQKELLKVISERISQRKHSISISKTGDDLLVDAKISENHRLASVLPIAGVTADCLALRMRRTHGCFFGTRRSPSMVLESDKVSDRSLSSLASDVASALDKVSSPSIEKSDGNVLDEHHISHLTGQTLFFNRPDSEHSPTTDSAVLSEEHQTSSQTKELLEVYTQLERLRDALLCRICMDEVTSQVFAPCGHAVCCQKCADMVKECPICRRDITSRNRFHAPWTMNCLMNEPCTTSANSSINASSRSQINHVSQNASPSEQN